MVQMNNQVTPLQAGHYSPSVNYSQPAKAPMPVQREPNIKGDDTDWGRVIGSAASAFSKAYGAYQENKQQNAVTEANNNLAMKFQEIKMAQRAGDISMSTANTMMDRVVMDALQAGMDPKVISNTESAYSGKIPEIEEETQKFYNKQALDHTKDVMDAIAKTNPWFNNLNYSDKITWYNHVNDGLDRCLQLERDIAGLEPGDPNYEMLKTSLLQEQTNTGMCQILTTLGGNDFFGGEKDLNELSVEELRAKWVGYAGRSDTMNMGVGEANLVFDIVKQRLGIDDIVGANSRFKDLTKKDLEATNTILEKAIENNSIMTYPEAYATKSVFGNRIFEEALQREPTFLKGIQNVASSLSKKMYGKALNEMPAGLLPSVLRNTNDMVSSPEAAKSGKVMSARLGVGSVVKFSLPNIDQSDEEIRIRMSNSRGAYSTLNFPVVKQFATSLGKSDDIQDKQDSKDITDDINKCTSSQCFFDAYQRPEWNYVSGIFKDEDIKTQLRYDETTGELFYTNNLTPEEAKTAKKLGVGWEMIKSQTLNTVGLSDGTLGQKIEYWNNDAASTLKTPEERVELWKRFNVRPASVGDTRVDLTKFIQNVDNKRNERMDRLAETLKEIAITSVKGSDASLIKEANAAEYTPTGGELSTTEMQQMDRQQVAQELIDRADALEEQYNNQSPAARKEYGAATLRDIKRARDKAAELLTAQASVSSSDTIGGASVAMVDEDITTAPEQSLEDRITEIRDNVLDFVKDVFHTEYSAKDLKKLQSRLNLANRVGDKEHAERLIKEIEKIMPEVKYKRDKELINKYMSTLQEMILSDNPEMRQNGIDFMREIIND